MSQTVPMSDNKSSLQPGQRVSRIWHNPEDFAGLHDFDTAPEPARPNPCVRSINWLKGWAIPGLGMFMESYMIFSTGQIKTIWHSAYPTCWLPKKGEPGCPNQVLCSGTFSPAIDPLTLNSAQCDANGTYPSDMLCSQSLLHTISYSEFAGIMAGMLVLSIVADRLGRRLGSITTASIMFCGGILMTLAPPFWGLNTMFLIFTISYGLYGFGVGGEYPTSASSAAEKAQGMSGKGTQRGSIIGMTFSCQGAGAVFGSIVILALLLITGQGEHNCNDPAYNEDGHSTASLDVIWRVTYGIGVLMTGCLLAYRFFRLKESNVWIENRARQVRKQKMGIYKYNLANPAHCYYIAFKHYWPRLIATAGTWFLWDVAFYGNKLFSGPIFSSMVPDGNLVKINGLILLNNSVALTGYWIAAHLIDYKWCGRTKLQTFGFAMCAILFLLAGVLYNTLSADLLLFLYIFSSFWGQCGPNMTTFVAPAELYPAAMRATCHGFSAFMGKAGALLATIAFNYLDTQGIFYVCAAVSFVSIFVTILFLPNVGQMDMIENDRYLEMILTGRLDEYGGEAVNPEYLSMYERMVGMHKTYDPDWLSTHRQLLLREMGEDDSDAPMDFASSTQAIVVNETKESLSEKH